MEMVTENFCDKILCLIWTQIKENGDSTKMKHYIYQLACSNSFTGNLVLTYNKMFSETGHSFEKSTELPLHTCFFKLIYKVSFFTSSLHWVPRK